MKKIALFTLIVLMLTTIAIAGCVDVGDTPNSEYTVTLGSFTTSRTGDVMVETSVSGPPKDIMVILEMDDFCSYQKVTKEALAMGQAHLTLAVPGKGYVTKPGSYQIIIREADPSSFNYDMDGKILYRKTCNFEGPKVSILESSVSKSTIRLTVKNSGDMPIVINGADIVLDGKVLHSVARDVIMPKETKVIEYYKNTATSSSKITVRLYSTSELVCTYEK